MSPADLVAILAFLAALLIGLFVMAVRGVLRQRPAGRVRSRLEGVTQLVRNPVRLQGAEDLSRAEREARRRQLRHSMGWLGHYMDRTETVAGRRGVYILVGGTLFLLIVTALVAWLFMPLPWWGKALIVVAVPCAGAVAIYQRLNEKFRLAFLEQLPDVLDMIIRASQAGVPVTQAIRSVGEEFAAPVGPEFRRIGDSLYLGNDMAVVLDEADVRIKVPDFSFLAVCLLLQRETGGSLGETLSNLATVIRSRRDLRLKTRALTAEGRFAGGMIAAIPPFILVMMSFLNADYIDVLFNSESGNKLLMVAAGMLILGILAIRKIAKLEV